MAMNYPFDDLALEFAQEVGLPWRDQVHLEAALSNLYLNLEEIGISITKTDFQSVISTFLVDLAEEVWPLDET
jgi:hypothetical protein